MRLPADENFPRRVVEHLRLAGHDVLWAGTDCPTTNDKAVQELAEPALPDRVEELVLLVLSRGDSLIGQVVQVTPVSIRHSSGGAGIGSNSIQAKSQSFAVLVSGGGIRRPKPVTPGQTDPLQAAPALPDSLPRIASPAI